MCFPMTSPARSVSWRVWRRRMWSPRCSTLTSSTTTRSEVTTSPTLHSQWLWTSIEEHMWHTGFSSHSHTLNRMGAPHGAQGMTTPCVVLYYTPLLNIPLCVLCHLSSRDSTSWLSPRTSWRDTRGRCTRGTCASIPNVCTSLPRTGASGGSGRGRLPRSPVARNCRPPGESSGSRANWTPWRWERQAVALSASPYTPGVNG